MAPLASLKDLFRMARSAATSSSTLSAYLVLHVTHPDPFCSTTIELAALELAAPAVVPDKLFQVFPALSNCYMASGNYVSISSFFLRMRRNGRMRTKSANQHDISSFRASACSSHGSGSISSPHPHRQRMRKPSVLNARMRWARLTMRKLLKAAGSVQWLRSAERMERVGLETCGLLASSKRRTVGVDMSRRWD